MQTSNGEFMLRKQAKVEQIERQLILEYLRRADWNVSAACALAGMHRSAFQRLMAKRGVRVAQARREWEQRSEAARAAAEAMP